MSAPLRQVPLDSAEPQANINDNPIDLTSQENDASDPNEKPREHRAPLGQVPVDSMQSQSNIQTVTDPNIKPHVDLEPPAQPVEIIEDDEEPMEEEEPKLPQRDRHTVPEQVPLDSTAIPPNTTSHVNVPNVDDLASSMAKNLNIADVDDEFDEGVQPKTVDWKKENKEMDKMFEAASVQQLKDLPEFEMPRGFKKSVDFFDHQKDGIRWLLQQEQNAPPNPFVRSRQLKDGTTALYDRLTRGRIVKPHAPVKGSILADDMGLGKTVQTFGLILSNPPKGYIYGVTDGDEVEGPICTLIVCPKSVISNWITQAKQFVKPRKLNIETYSGTPKQRSKLMQTVEDNEVDILISTYETIASEYEKDRKDLLGIHDLCYHRIVLDEAQQIRNPKSKCFKAIEAVAKESEYRLALTGTPFINHPSDIHSLLAFIGLQPLSDANTFKTFISDPIKDRRRAGLTRLRAALAYVALRRTKNVLTNLDMAEKTVQIVEVEFPEGNHKDIHDVLYLAARAAFEASINGKGKGYTESEGGVTANAQQAMFSLLLRVRQSCASGCLVSAGHYEAANQVMAEIASEGRELTARDGDRMIDHLQSAKPENDKRLQVEGNSPKIDALLKAIGNMEADEKGVIFSQWTSMLDLIQAALNAAGYKYTRIDGSMSIEDRTEALELLTHDESTRFILCSLKAAGVGLNLTRANVCFMMDPWWNASIENQAIDRVHRMGQKRPVRVYRFVMKGTIEERMLDVQRAKSALGKGAMQKISAAEERVAKITGLRDLFEINDAEDDMDGFINNTNDWY